MKSIFALLGIIISASLSAQIIKPDVSKINNKSDWKIVNRVVKVTNENLVAFNANQGDGLAVYQLLEFQNGTIEFDVKGKNVPGQSFVGVAFHIEDEDTFNAIYFRPFNFTNPDKTRSGHSVQYISHPEFTWQFLRTNFPEQFENPVNPVPNPEDFFHAKIEVSWPEVKVFVENSLEPSLAVKMKSSFRKGKVGFWVGHGSDGTFKNLVITKM